MNSKEFWLGAAAGIIANFLTTLLYFGLKFGWKNTIPTLGWAFKFSGKMRSLKMVAFNRSRDDYAHSHPYAKSVPAYASQAKRTLVFVSINLVSGLSFDGLCNTLREMLEREPGVEITISLLNPTKGHLIACICTGHDITETEMAGKINGTLKSLTLFKDSLSKNAQARFKIRLHNTVPWASAILVDHDQPNGRIQFETKAYKTSFRESFGFELENGGIHPMYKMFVKAYLDLVKDGQDYVSTEMAP